MSRSVRFLKAVIGENGTVALLKSVESNPQFENVILPRAIYSWLNAIEEYNGKLPGTLIPLNLQKNDLGFSGDIAVNDTLLKFENDSVFRVMGSISIALNSKSISANIKEHDLMRLGKNIDILVKSNIAKKRVTSLSELKSRIKGKTLKKEDPASAKQGFTRAGKPSEPKQPLGFEEPTYVQTKQQFQTKRFGKSELNTRCGGCSMLLFKNEEFRGCLCFHELAKYTTTLKKGDDILLSFGKEWDNEALLALLGNFKR